MRQQPAEFYILPSETYQLPDLEFEWGPLDRPGPKSKSGLRGFYRYFDSLPSSPHPSRRPDFEATSRLACTVFAGDTKESDIPAGYTYFGQFLAHDLTEVPRGEVVNRRTPRLDLDCLYGPAMSPVSDYMTPEGYFRMGGVGIEKATEPCDATVRNFDLVNGIDHGGRRPLLSREFDRKRQRGCCSKHRMREGRRRRNRSAAIAQFDLPRFPDGRARIPDARNDQNMIVGEMHRALMRAHDALMTVEGAADAAKEARLSASVYARRELTWHYQYVVFHDYLMRILSPGEADRLAGLGPRLENGLSGVRPSIGKPGTPTITAEFATAAFRFGHSMARESYRLSDATSAISLIPPSLGRAGALQRNTHLLGQDDLPRSWEIDWGFFLEMPEELRSRTAPDKPQSAMRIDRTLAPAMGRIPFDFCKLASAFRVSREDISLPFLTLAESLARDVVSGGEAARALGIEPEGDEDLPLWLYCLDESERENAGRLGRVASRIVLDTFLAAVFKDEGSFVHAPASWRPWAWRRERAVAASFTLTDLVMIGSEAAPVDRPLQRPPAKVSD